MVTIRVSGKNYEALVDTGATFSMLPEKPPSGEGNGKYVTVEGIEGKQSKLPICRPLLTKVGNNLLEHAFVYSPACPVALLGRDLLTKLQAEIFFRGDQMVVQLPVKQGSNYQMVLLKDESSVVGIKDLENVNPQVWADGTPARAKHVMPVRIYLKEGEGPICVKQYTLNRQTRRGLKRLIEKFKGYGWLVEGSSPFNTPILGVPKADGTSYRLVQDLRAVNQKVLADYPVVPNPHAILTQVPLNAKIFSVLDLRDAFFSIPLHEDSQKLFAFEWEDPDTHHKSQLMWTVLPQGFVSAPHIFGISLQKDLEDWKQVHPNVTLIQYVDDLLIARPSLTKGKEATESLLNTLGERGYKVSREKAQICQSKVTFLGYEISKGAQALRIKKKAS
uniref:ribonuclease H n=1 Tax=Crocodylus porosus TaxID=8502 RepID=A0A7M4FLL9_CROPO